MEWVVPPTATAGALDDLARRNDMGWGRDGGLGVWGEGGCGMSFGWWGGGEGTTVGGVRSFLY